MTTQLSIFFLSAIQKRIKNIAFDRDNSDLVKYASPIFTQLKALIYNPNPGYTIENPKGAERVEVLTIRRTKIRASQTCIHFYCAIIGVSYPETPGFALKKIKMS